MTSRSEEGDRGVSEVAISHQRAAPSPNAEITFPFVRNLSCRHFVYIDIVLCNPTKKTQTETPGELVLDTSPQSMIIYRTFY